MDDESFERFSDGKLLDQGSQRERSLTFKRKSLHKHQQPFQIQNSALGASYNLTVIQEQSHSSAQQSWTAKLPRQILEDPFNASGMVKSQRTNSVAVNSDHMRSHLSKENYGPHQNGLSDNQEISAQQINLSIPRDQLESSGQNIVADDAPPKDPNISSNYPGEQQSRIAASLPDESTLGSKINETITFGFKSRKEFLKTISYKRLKSLQQIMFLIVYTLFCSEAVLRSVLLQTVPEDSDAVEFNFGTIVQQIVSFIVFLVLLKLKKVRCSAKIPRYIILQILLVAQQPFDAQTLAHHLTSSLNHTLLQIVFMLTFCPIFELTVFIVPLIVLNQKLRLAYYQQPEWYKQDLSSENAILKWYDHLVDAALMVLVMFVLSLMAFQIDILRESYKQSQKYNEQNLIKKNSDDDMFDEANIGVLNCDSFEKTSDNKKLLDGFSCGAGLIEGNRIMGPPRNSGANVSHKFSSKRLIQSSPSPHKQLLSMYRSDEPFLVVNKQLKDFLFTLNGGLEYSLDAQVFYKYRFDRLPFEPYQMNQDSVSSVEPEDVDQHEPSFDCQFETNMFSLRELIQMLVNSKENSTGRMYIKVYRYQTMLGNQNNSFVTQNSMPGRAAKSSEKDEFNLCWKPPPDAESNVDTKLSQLRKALEEEESKATKRSQWLFFELSVRPIYLKDKVNYLVQMTQINYLMHKIVKMTSKSSSDFPTGFTSKESFASINSIVKNSQMIEQVICKLSGFQSRTSILDVGCSEEIELQQEAGNTNLSNTALGRIQFYLSNIWCQSTQMSYRLKSRLSHWLVKNKKIILNFQKVSSQSISIENHVKQFLLILSPQIEAKNLHITVTQGSMPDDELYTDWNQYDQILYQIIKNAIDFNNKNGAISISILFMKEKRNLFAVGSKDRTSKLQADNFSCHEIGKIVTVVKDTGQGMDMEDQTQLFKRRTTRKKTEYDYRRKPESNFGQGLMVAKTLTEQLGGKIIVKSKLGCFTQVTFDVQCTMYNVKNFDPQLKQLDSEPGLALPLKEMRRLSDAVMPGHPDDCSEHPIDNDENVRKSSKLRLGEKMYRSDLSCISINEASVNSDAEMINCAFKQYNTLQEVLEGVGPGQEENYYQPLQPQNEFFQLDKEIQDKIDAFFEPKELDLSQQQPEDQMVVNSNSNGMSNVGDRRRFTNDSNVVRATEESKVQQSEQGWGTDASKPVEPVSTQKKSSNERKMNCLADALRVSRIHKIRSGGKPYPYSNDRVQDEAKSHPKSIDQNPIQNKNSFTNKMKSKRACSVQLPPVNSNLKDSDEARFPQSNLKDDRSIESMEIDEALPQEEEKQGLQQNLSHQQNMKKGSSNISDSVIQSLKFDLVNEIIQQNKLQLNERQLVSDYSSGESENQNEKMLERNFECSNISQMMNQAPLSDIQNKNTKLLFGNKGAAMFNQNKLKDLNTAQQQFKQRQEANFLMVGDSLGQERFSVNQLSLLSHNAYEMESNLLQEQPKKSLSALKKDKSDQRMKKSFQPIKKSLDIIQLNKSSSGSKDKIIESLPAKKQKHFNFGWQKNCLCKDLLVVDRDLPTVQIIQETLLKEFPNGADFAQTESEAQDLLSLKLQANCCKNNYDLVFVSLDNSQEGIDIAKKLKETINLWNTKMSDRGIKKIPQPIIVGMVTSEAQKQEAFNNQFDLLVSKNPIVQDEIWMIPQLPQFQIAKLNES